MITRPSYGAEKCLRRYPPRVPTYQYRCDHCEQQFDLWQSFSDDTLKTCPSTGGPGGCAAPGNGDVRKVFSSVGITFKGDGFYKNDYGANSSGRKKEMASSSSAGGSSSDSSSESSSESSSSSSEKSNGTSDSTKTKTSSGSADKTSANSSAKKTSSD